MAVEWGSTAVTHKRLGRGGGQNKYFEFSLFLALEIDMTGVDVREPVISDNVYCAEVMPASQYWVWDCLVDNFKIICRGFHFPWRWRQCIKCISSWQGYIWACFTAAPMQNSFVWLKEIHLITQGRLSPLGDWRAADVMGLLSFSLFPPSLQLPFFIGKALDH